ncbi:3-hydroxyacyl-CoA dehydrogenase NAD-binding domain-containing protein [Helcobacillus massiliensis]|uniref:3-hydroxyacyl-CoA dehydrogenase/enoyl-CoA hydratase/carnithine racemase n=1 Tax=Helcobacillus massiliensis TaxID=521392 RepID=A0A839QXQ6_9MICO|nr:3-hydroxyacyl-CoA dehydrogenase NAD-binding domain-containing protein [Helcobacillus massiliensis]MBB3023620.1 3-hydroxyacyl-CoA dehydrogenase/enoyl-CoA hydratase/carnithine racemase [Helcobacillus massiliensis]
MTNYTEQVTAFDYEVRDHATLGPVGVITARAGGPKPATLGRQSVDNLVEAVAQAVAAAGNGDIRAIALTGEDRIFLAGADLAMFAAGTDPEVIRDMTRKMHGLQVLLRTVDVPVLAHINGAALGGGLETALMASIRTAGPQVKGIGLPETSLGILPGWGGTTLLPALIDPEDALTIIVDEPAKDRTMDAQTALERGVVLALVDDLDAALDYVAENPGVSGAVGPDSRSSAADSADGADRAADAGDSAAAAGAAADRAEPLPAADSDRAKALVEALKKRERLARVRDAQGAPATLRVLTLVTQLLDSTLEDALAREADAIVELAQTPAAEGALHAAELLRRGKPSRTPIEGAKDITKVGVAGAGLMASQIAAQLARGLRVPVIMRDLDDAIAAKGLANAQRILTDAGDADAAELLSATTDLEDLRGADLVLEAVPEVMGIKQSVFAELEDVLEADALLVTNTSSLSVTEMSSKLDHPERVVGLHFFNPVAKMPLVEVIHTDATDETTLATGREVVRRMRKFAVDSADAPGFIVNRLLFRMLGTVLSAIDAGASAQKVDESLDALGLPMRPLTLLDMVGLAVADHVGQVMVDKEGPERFHASRGLHAMAEAGERFTEEGHRPPAPVRAEVDEVFARANEGEPDQPRPKTGDRLLEEVEKGLADEITRMVDEGVVQRIEDIDLALILGAGFPRHRGGISTYLRQRGLL